MTFIIGRRDRQCRCCGCTDDRACPGGCAWVLLDIQGATGICSACAELMEWDQVLLAGVDNLGEDAA